VRFYIFLPETLAQLDDVELQPRVPTLPGKVIRWEQPVTFSNGQGGNVETVTNATGTKTIYIDFPKTMKVLMNVVNLKVSSTIRRASRTGKEAGEPVQ